MREAGGPVEEGRRKPRFIYSHKSQKERKSQEIVVEFPLDTPLGSLKVGSVLTELCPTCFTGTEL